MNKLICLLILVAPLTVSAKDRIILTRGRGVIAGIATALFIANADGTGERKLLSTSEFDYSPSFSKDGRWIVFTSERNGSSDIYRVHVDGSGLERLTDDPSFDDQAVLSPDGKQLAFVSTRAKGTTDIWVLDLKSRKLRNLTQGAGGNFRPSWSPDGQWIAFSSDRNTTSRRRSVARFEQVQEASVYLMRSNGRDLSRLTSAGKYAGSPSWSDDGKQVLFYEMTLDHGYDARAPVVPADVVSQLIAIDVATGRRTELTSGPGVKVAPQFVNGEVAYLVKSGEHVGLAFTKSGYGAAGAMRSPTWSSDGKQVVYQKVLSGPFVQNQPLFSKYADEFELAWSNPLPAFSRSGRLAATTPLGDGLSPAPISVMDADGSNAQRLLNEGSGVAFGASWSLDEQWIAFGFGAIFRGATRPAQVMMAHADGSEARELTSGSGNSGFPSFSPDGKRIVYRVWGEGDGLRMLSLESGSITTLTTEPDNFPSWSPTADAIVFTRAVDGGYDIFSIRSDGTNLKRLTTAPGNDAHAAWSPDGKQLLFSSARLGFEDESPLYDAAPQPYAELFIMNADGSNQRPLTDNKWEDGTPAWQPVLGGK